MRMLRLALVLGLFLVLTTWVASAAPPDPPHPGPAMFLDFPDCWIFDVDFNWFYIEDCSPTISLVTNSRTDVKLWTAKAQLPEGAVLPEKGAVHITYENSGFACWWDEYTLTTKYNITITPKGQFNVSCHFRPDRWQPD